MSMNNNWTSFSWWMSKMSISGNKKIIEQGDSIDSEYLPSFINNKNEFDLPEEIDNGLCLNNFYLPEEIILHILSYVDPKELLNCSLVCHKWNNLIKTYVLWSEIYKRRYKKQPKKLPWYLYYSLLSTNYFDTNLMLNGNGQDNFKNWEIKYNEGDGFLIEDPPVGADPLPQGVQEFYNKTSCFATSYSSCCKIQRIDFGKNKLLQYILNNYKPHIYLSEWTAGRFDCGCVYKLECDFVAPELPPDFTRPGTIHHVQQWQGSKWEKIEMTITDYPDGIEGIIFEHEGRDTQFWAGHYGSKMAGGVVKILFDTLEPLPTKEDGSIISKKFQKICFVSNGNQALPPPNIRFPQPRNVRRH